MAEEQREDQLVQKILEFVGISQATEGEALEYLQRHRNDLEGAVAAYFNDKEQRRRGPSPRGGGGGGGLTAHNARNTTSSSRGSSKPLPAARNNYSSGPPITVRLFLEHNMREWKRVDLVDVEHPTVEHEKGSIASLKELCGRLIVAETVTTDRLVHELRGKGKSKKAAAAVTAGGAPASLHKKNGGGEKKREAQKSSDRRKKEREELPPPLSAVGPSSSTGLKNKEDEDDDDEGEEESGVKDWSKAHAPLITEFDVLKDSLPLDLCQYLQYLRKCRPRAQQCRFGQDATLYDVGVWASLNFGIPLHRMRFWAFVKRRNRTTRPAFPFEPSKFTQPIQSLLQHKRSTVLNLFLEESTAPKVSHTQEYLTFATIEAAWQPSAVVPHPSGSNDTKAHTPLFPVHNPEEDAMIFFKYYDPSTETLTYICHLYVHLDQQIENVVPLLNEKMGFSNDLSLLLFEEINEVMIDPLSASDTFRKAELSNGDCITFQLCPSEGSTCRWALATDYYQYLLRWMRVSFRTAVAPYEEVCCLLIEKTATYEQILGQLATFLCLDMSDIHLLSLYEHNGPHGRPAPKAIAPDDTWVASRLLRPTGPQYQHSSSNLTLYFSFCEL